VTEGALWLVTALLLLFVVLLWLFRYRVKAGHVPSLRHIPAFEDLKGFTGQAIETGRPLHISLGTGSMANETAADSLAGLSILNYLAEQAAATGIHPTISMADPTVMLFAQNTLRTAYEDDTSGIEAAYRNVRWIAPQSAAYAAGVMSLLSIDNVETNVMVGNFGDEYLLMGEASVRHRVSHIGGASDPNTLPFIYASAQKILLGEEIYAAGAYLQKRPAHVGSLLAQDTMRWIIAAIILVGVGMTSLGSL
jgi:hypothetical protein